MNLSKEGLGLSSNEISRLPARARSAGLGPQGELDLAIERQAEIEGVGMGVLRDGTAFLTGRGLARLVGLENRHIRTISQEWDEEPQKARVTRIKEILSKRGIELASPHIETSDGGRQIHAFPDYVCLAILEYYSFDTQNPRETARDNYRILAGKALQDLIYNKVGYSPDSETLEPLCKWHERIELNHQSAPRGYFSIFNEAHTVIYELIMAGADVGENIVPDISIGQHWAKHWDAFSLNEKYGNRHKFPHRYTDDHPQAKANPQIANCYPLEALGEYRRWLQEDYLEGGKLAGYLNNKRREIPPSVSQLAIERLSPAEIEERSEGS